MRLLVFIIGCIGLLLISAISGISFFILFIASVLSGLVRKKPDYAYFILSELLFNINIIKLSNRTVSSVKYRVTATKQAANQAKFVIEMITMNAADNTLPTELISTDVQTAAFNTSADMAISAFVPNGKNVKISYFTVELFKQ